MDIAGWSRGNTERTLIQGCPITKANKHYMRTILHGNRPETIGLEHFHQVATPYKLLSQWWKKDLSDRYLVKRNVTRWHFHTRLHIDYKDVLINRQFSNGWHSLFNDILRSCSLTICKRLIVINGFCMTQILGRLPHPGVTMRQLQNPTTMYWIRNGKIGLPMH